MALIHEHPLTFYSWLAMGQLERLDISQAKKVWGTLSKARRSIVGSKNDNSSLVLTKTLEVALLLKQVNLQKKLSNSFTGGQNKINQLEINRAS